jgi:hypothetical protein
MVSLGIMAIEIIESEPPLSQRRLEQRVSAERFLAKNKT